jgi:hypothetical protein
MFAMIPSDCSPASEQACQHHHQQQQQQQSDEHLRETKYQQLKSEMIGSMHQRNRMRKLVIIQYSLPITAIKLVTYGTCWSE